MPIVISAVIDVDPAKRDQIIRSAQPHIDGALEEPGCRDYTWSFDANHPGRVHVFELWDDEASLKGHFDSEPYAKMRQHLQDAGIVAATSAKYRVDLIESVYDETGQGRADFFTHQR